MGTAGGAIPGTTARAGTDVYKRQDLTERAVIRETAIEDNGKKAVRTVRAVPTLQRWEDRVVMATVPITNVETAMLRIAEDNRLSLIHILTSRRNRRSA